MSQVVVDRERVANRVRPRIGRRAFVAAGLLTLFAAAAGYGVDWWTEGRFIASTDDAYVGGDVTPIAPHVAGFVAAILVGDNQYVHAGQKLIRLQGRDFRAALDRAKATVKGRDAAIADFAAQIAAQHARIAAARATLAGKQADAAFAGQDAARYRVLARAEAGSRQAAQRSLAVSRAASASVVAARASLAAATAQLAVLDAGLAEASAAAAAARAARRTARLDLGYTLIRAPIDGYVGNRAAQVGAYVPAGSYLLSVVPAHGLWVDANFKEDELARMHPGEAARVVADVLPGRVFHGHVASLAAASGDVFSVIPAENATGNFTKIVQRVPVRIVLDGRDATLGLLRPGLSATVSVDTK